MSTSWNQQREAFWREHIHNHGRSGLPIKAYCQQFDLHPHTFYVWRRRLESQGDHRTGGAPPVRFAVVEAAAPIDTATISITLTSGDRIDLPSSIPSTTLEAIITALRATSTPRS